MPKRNKPLAACRARCRFADEYDAAQERDVVQTHDGQTGRRYYRSGKCQPAFRLLLISCRRKRVRPALASGLARLHPIYVNIEQDQPARLLGCLDPEWADLRPTVGAAFCDRGGNRAAASERGEAVQTSMRYIRGLTKMKMK
jgi:hypothetical protein